MFGYGSKHLFAPRRPVTYVTLCVVSDIAVKKRYCLCAVNTGQA
ncbi:hypothetical protein KPSA1_03335 [Pseudomonas syringae pv. actinidiae]|uniref:Uncharacterized protein n=1 Tax=Pseudomonas syringae pv. actinidiae TaxID=103796 RepID=A0A2V0QAR0_PSESF|nr:hypothetical protein KPSA1_03335 [Pseudomonas syringae pv. actinidiae]